MNLAEDEDAGTSESEGEQHNPAQALSLILDHINQLRPTDDQDGERTILRDLLQAEIDRFPTCNTSDYVAKHEAISQGIKEHFSEGRGEASGLILEECLSRVTELERLRLQSLGDVWNGELTLMKEGRLDEDVCRKLSVVTDRDRIIKKTFAQVVSALRVWIFKRSLESDFDKVSSMALLNRLYPDHEPDLNVFLTAKMLAEQRQGLWKYIGAVERKGRKALRAIEENYKWSPLVDMVNVYLRTAVEMISKLESLSLILSAEGKLEDGFADSRQLQDLTLWKCAVFTGKSTKLTPLERYFLR